MKICAVISGRPDITPGGVELSLWKISKELQKLGSEIHIIFDKATDPKGPTDFIVDNIYFHAVAGLARVPLGKALSFRSAACRSLIETHKKFGIDLFSFHGNYSLLPVNILRNYADEPFVYHTYATLLFEAKTHLFRFNNLKMAKNLARKSSMYLFYTPLEMISIRFVDRIIVPSQLTVNEYVHYYHYSPIRIAIAPLGQDLFERYQENISIKQKDEFNGKKVILFVGNEWYRKGVWCLLLAFKAYHTKVPNSILIMTGPPQEPFISLIKSLNLENSVQLVGNVAEEKLVYYYSNCDVFVLPSFHEGFSNTIIEVMAFGKPVITTPIAGYPVVENGKDGFIVQPGDYKTIADLLSRLLGNREVYRQISKNAAEKSKKYTWVESAKQVLNIYRDLVTNRG